MHTNGLLDDDVWAKFDYETPLWLQVPAAAKWYGGDKGLFSSGFQEYLEKRLVETEKPDVMPTFSKALPKSDT
jgi:hypothetical protein